MQVLYIIEFKILINEKEIKLKGAIKWKDWKGLVEE